MRRLLMLAAWFALLIGSSIARAQPILVDDAGSSYTQARTGLAPQLAMAEARQRGADRARLESAARLLDGYMKKHFASRGNGLTPRDPRFAGEFLDKARVYDESFASFAAALKDLQNTLAPAPAPGAELLAYLREPGGAEVLFASGGPGGAPSPSTPPSDEPIARELMEIFEARPDGTLAIPEAGRAAARDRLAQSERLLQAIDKAQARLGRSADRMTDDDDATRRFKRMITGRVYASASALKELSEMRSPDYAEIPERVSASLKRVLKEGKNDRLSLPEGALRRSVMDAMDQMDALSARVEAIRPGVRRIAERLSEADDLHRGWKRLLLDDATLVNLAMKASASTTPRAPGAPESASGLALTPIGRYLAPAKGGGVRFNRFRANMAGAELRALRDTLAVYQFLGPRFDDIAGRLDDRALADAFRSDAVRAVLSTAFARGARGAEADAAPLEHSAENTSRLASVLDSHESPLRVDLRGASFSSEPVDLFRTSVFYNPRTALSRQLYFSEFPDHHAARLFGLFEWNALQSTDMRSYLARLEQERPRIAELARTHEALVVMINFMPSWLSRSRDTTPLDGHYLARNGARPRDWAQWERMVIETVRFMEEFRGPELYFEIWNEPDGYWAEDLDAYLELYERTARAIKGASPRSKVGGCGINHWQGKVKASPGSEPVNVELIRFCGERDVPLDFVSWHQFTRPISQVREARKVYEHELRRAGFERMPEFIVSEWNVAEKGSSYEAVAFAETMVEFVEAGVDMQTYASWEEFNADEPDPDSFGPWGLITQKGQKKPPYFVHEFFDRLSRDSRGIAIFRADDQRMTCVVSRKDDGTYEALAWEVGLYGPRMDAAINALAKAGLRNDDLKAYGDLEGVEVAIRENKPARREHAKAFDAAFRAYQDAPQPENYLILELPGVSRIDLLDAESVRNAPGDPALAATSDRIAIKAERNEVVWFRFRAE